MKWLLTVVCISLALFLVVPFALGAGYGMTGGSVDFRPFANVNEYEVSGDGNQVVSVAGDGSHVTSTVTEPSLTKMPPVQKPGWSTFCAGGLMFIGLVCMLAAGMRHFGRLA